jgi:CubicO group peptidase (beta-lactamase class C family)
MREMSHTPRKHLGMSRLLAGLSLLWISQAHAADSLDDRMQAFMREQHVPGTAVVIVREGRVADARVYGKANIEFDAPVTLTTPFQIASATKPFVGTLLMILVSEGKLALDAPVGRYLQSIPFAWRQVTIRQLATHHSGLPDVVKLPAPPQTREEMIRVIGWRHLEYTPGKRASYNVTDSVVLQMAMEQVTGLSLAELLRQRIFAPLGMKDTRFSDTIPRTEGRNSELSLVIAGRASIYRWQDGRQWNDDFPYLPYSYAAGGLYSSAADLGRFYAAIFSGALLTPSARAEMWHLAEGTKTGFGLNWIVDDSQGRTMVGHAGGPALGDIICLTDTGSCVIVLTNQKTLQPGLAQELLQTPVAVPSPPI